MWQFVAPLQYGCRMNAQFVCHSRVNLLGCRIGIGAIHRNGHGDGAHEAPVVMASHHHHLGHRRVRQHHILHRDGAHPLGIHFEEIISTAHMPVDALLLDDHVAHADPLAHEQVTREVGTPEVAGCIAVRFDPQLAGSAAWHWHAVCVAEGDLGTRDGSPEASGQVITRPGGQHHV